MTESAIGQAAPAANTNPVVNARPISSRRYLAIRQGHTLNGATMDWCDADYMIQQAHAVSCVLEYAFSEGASFNDQISSMAVRAVATLNLLASAALADEAAAADDHYSKAADEADAATARFNRLPEDLEHTNAALFEREEQLMYSALERLEQTPVATWHDSADKVERVLANRATPSEEVVNRLIACGRRLSAEGR